MNEQSGMLRPLLALALLLSGCTPGGLLNMDERWCTSHPHAPAYRCLDHK